MKTLQITVIAVCVAFTACDSTPKPTSITADELLLAQGGQVFTVTIPNTVDPKAFAGLALKHFDGTISPFGSSNSLKPDQELKVFVFDPKAGSLRYAILGKNGYTQRGEATNFPSFGMQAPNPISVGIGVDQPIMRFARSNTVSLPFGDLAEGEFDLIFHIQ